MERLLRFALSVKPLAALAVLASIATILAFVAGRLSLNEGESASPIVGFLLRWWPELIFYPCILLILAVLVLGYLSSATISIQHHRFTYTRVVGQEPVYPEGRTRVDLLSEDEHFAVQLAGRIYGPELQAIFRHFEGDRDEAGAPPKIPVYLWVSELTRSESPLWWPQQPSYLEPSGSYVSEGYLGGIGIDSATDGEAFELRIYLPSRLGVSSAPYHAVNSLQELPHTLFVSEPLYITTRRSDQWMSDHSRRLQEIR